MNSPALGPFWSLVAIQSGVISRRQAITAGVKPATIDNRLRSGQWRSLQRGVYLISADTPDREAELWAVVLRAGPPAALSYTTAAELFGLDRPSRRLIHVTVPINRKVGFIRGASVHHSRSIDSSRDRGSLLPRTRIECTVLDLTQAAATFDEAFDWLCKAIGRRLTTPERLRAELQARSRVRWRADLLLALGDVADGARSPLERRYITGVERPHDLPPARRQAKVVSGGKTRYIDNFYEEAHLAVELDGSAWHPPEQRWSDQHRDNALAGLGILTLRYNWSDVTSRPCAVAAEVASLIHARGVVLTPQRCGPRCTGSFF